MGVLKPYGDSRLYDVAVEDGGRILRVQVKCTMFRRRGSGYSLNILGPGRKRYPKGSVDFFAVFIIPIDEWYIIPYAAMGRRRTMHVTPGSRRAQWGPYLEAWELLRGEAGGLVIQACVDPELEGEIAGLDWGECFDMREDCGRLEKPESQRSLRNAAEVAKKIIVLDHLETR